MIPAFFFTIQIKGRRIPFPLPIILPLIFILEIIAIPTLLIYGIKKKQYMPLKVVSRLYLTRLFINLIIHGRKFKVRVHDGNNVVRVSGTL